MITLGENLNTVGALRNALRDVPDSAFLNIGNQNYGFSVDEIHYDGLSVALETTEEGVFEPVTDGKIAAAIQCLIENGIDPDEAENVLQAIGYILLNAEFFPDRDRKTSLSDQIQSASSRAAESHSSDKATVKETTPAR